MRAPSRREWTLLLLLAVVGIVVLFLGDGNILTGSSGTASEEGKDLGQAPVVNLARLNLDPEPYDAAGRDLFKYGPPPRVERAAPPPPPPPPPPVERPRPQRPVNTNPPPPPTPREPAKPRPPTPDFEYLGFLGPKDNRIFVFGKDEDLMLARVGETVQGQFKVVEFKYEAVVMGYTDEQFADMTTELTWKR